MHDINYLRYVGDEKLIDRSDLLALRDSDNSLAGWALKMGLAARTKLGLQFDGVLQGKTKYETNDIGFRLQEYVLRNPEFINKFKQLGFQPNKHIIRDYNFR